MAKKKATSLLQLKDAYFFPHFCNARNDRKIKRLRKELGIEGYGIFFMLLEILRDQSDYSYPLSDLDLLADEMGTSEAKVSVVVNNYGMFAISNDERFFSPKLLLYLQPYFQASQRAKLAAKARWDKDKKEQIPDNSNADAMQMHSKCDANGMPIITNGNLDNGNVLNKEKKENFSSSFPEYPSSNSLNDFNEDIPDEKPVPEKYGYEYFRKFWNTFDNLAKDNRLESGYRPEDLKLLKNRLKEESREDIEKAIRNISNNLEAIKKTGTNFPNSIRALLTGSFSFWVSYQPQKEKFDAYNVGKQEMKLNIFTPLEGDEVEII